MITELYFWIDIKLQSSIYSLFLCTASVAAFAILVCFQHTEWSTHVQAYSVY